MAAGKALPVQIVVTAVDNVTMKFMEINEKVKKLGAPVKQVTSAFSMLSEESGLKKLGERLGEAGKTGKEAFSETAEAIAKITATVGLAAGGIFELVKSFGESSEEIKLLSDRLGISTKSVQELQYAAAQAGMEQEQFTHGLDKFGRGIVETAMGTGEAMLAFNAMGISVRDSTGKLKTVDTLLPEVANKLGKYTNAGVKATLMHNMFGKGGEKWVAMLGQGAEGLAKVRAEAAAAGAIMSDEDLEKGEKFEKGWKSIQATFRSIKNMVGAELAPAITDMMKTFQQFLLDNREALKAFAEQFVQNLPGYIQQIKKLFGELSDVVSVVSQAFSWLCDRFGAVNVVLGGLILFFGSGAIASIATFGGALASLATAVCPVVISAIALLMPPLLGLLGTVVGLAIAFWPFIAAGAALAAIGVLLYNKWKPFRDIVDGISDSVKGFFGFGGSGPGPQASASSAAGPVLGSPLGVQSSIDSLGQSTAQKNENHILVELMGLPPGSRVSTPKAESPMDLVYSGVGH